MEKSFESLVKEKFNVANEEIMRAKIAAAESGAYLSDLLVKKNLIKEEDALNLYSHIYDMPVVEKLPNDIDISFTQSVPITFLRKNSIVPIVLIKDKESKGDEKQDKKVKDASNIMIAMSNPENFQVLDELVSKLCLDDFSFSKNEIVLSYKEEIESLISFAYDRGRGSAQDLVEGMEEDSGSILSEIEKTADLLDDTSDAPIIKLVNHMISQSIKARASDIHVEPYQESLKVRYRVDGILYDLLSPPKWIQSSLVSRIKVMAKLDIAEKRLPQDGRIEVKIGTQDVDIRVSTIPTSFGERVVLRLLNKSSALLQLSEFGLEKKYFDIIQKMIVEPNGIILVTGPTGSGKTTTLYAVLMEINKPEINIITVEDPVEYKIDGISQIQVNPKIDLTFARALRSIVRQDPDVILIGEIRDKETADIAVQSALTGHLVFSTLHTNDAPSTVTRLLDIGVEPFLIGSAVNAIMAQRLVRVLCPHCKKPYKPSQIELDQLDIRNEKLKNANFYKAIGCKECFHTGYKGRVMILEIMLLTDTIKRLILAGKNSGEIKEAAVRKNNMITLREDGIRKALAGVTTIEEILRVTHAEDTSLIA